MFTLLKLGASLVALLGRTNSDKKSNATRPAATARNRALTAVVHPPFLGSEHNSRRNDDE